MATRKRGGGGRRERQRRQRRQSRQATRRLASKLDRIQDVAGPIVRRAAARVLRAERAWLAANKNPGALSTSLASPRGQWRQRWERELARALVDAYQRGAASFGAGQVPRSTLVRLAERRAREAARMIAATTTGKIGHARAQAAGSPATRAILRNVYGQEALAQRAQRIADVEARAAAAEGEYLAASAAGVTEKEWRHDGNPKEPRPEHLALHGVRVPLDDVFPNGLRFPHDPEADLSETINCTCSLWYVQPTEAER